MRQVRCRVQLPGHESMAVATGLPWTPRRGGRVPLHVPRVFVTRGVERVCGNRPMDRLPQGTFRACIPKLLPQCCWSLGPACEPPPVSIRDPPLSTGGAGPVSYKGWSAHSNGVPAVGLFGQSLGRLDRVPCKQTVIVLTVCGRMYAAPHGACGVVCCCTMKGARNPNRRGNLSPSPKWWLSC